MTELKIPEKFFNVQFRMRTNFRNKFSDRIKHWEIILYFILLILRLIFVLFCYKIFIHSKNRLLGPFQVWKIYEKEVVSRSIHALQHTK